MSTHLLRGSGALAGTAVQRPRALGKAQKTQSPLQVVSQQTPSTQLLLLHSASPLQVCPFCFLPQLLLMQVLPPVQSELLVQVPLQSPLAQLKGAQDSTTPATQSPAPLHTLA